MLEVVDENWTRRGGSACELLAEKAYSSRRHRALLRSWGSMDFDPDNDTGVCRFADSKPPGCAARGCSLDALLALGLPHACGGDDLIRATLDGATANTGRVVLPDRRDVQRALLAETGKTLPTSFAP